MDYLRVSDIPHEVLQQLPTSPDFNATDNPNETLKLLKGVGPLSWKARLYSSENYERFKQIKEELREIPGRLTFFDGGGIPQLTPFDDNTWTFPHEDMFEHQRHAFVPAVALKVAYHGLPSGQAFWRDEEMSGPIHVTKKIIDEIAPYVHGFKRPLLYSLALSQDKEDRKRAKKIIKTEIIDRLDAKRRGWINQGVSLVKEIEGLPYQEVTIHGQSEPELAQEPQRPKKRSLLSRLFRLSQ
jgi:hypothetical protein